MKNKWLPCLLLIALLGCRGGTDTDTQGSDPDLEWDTSDLPARAQINSTAGDIISEWPEFQELEKSMDGLYRIENTEELRLLLDELVEKQKTLEDSEYPEEFDKPQIRSRQKVFLTYLLKLKASLIYRTTPMEPAKEMIGAYNELADQFNYMVNYQLDSTLITNE